MNMTRTSRPDAGLAAMLFAGVRAEFFKAVSVRYLKMTALVVGLLVLGVAAAVGAVVRNSMQQYGKGETLLVPQFVLLGATTIGAIVLLVGVSWISLGEHSTRVVGLTYTVLPNRSVAVLAQAVLAAGFSMVLGYVVIPLAYVIGESLATGSLVSPERLLAAGGWRPVVVLPLVLGCQAALAVAVGAAVRRVPVAVAAIVVWHAVGEDAVRGLPVIGRPLGYLLPVGNGYHVAGIQGGSPEPPWGAWGSAVCLAGAVALSLMLACWASNRRDVRG